MHHIPRPAAPYGGETGAVRHIEHTAELVLDLVCRPVLHLADAHKIVVGKAARPHEIGARVVVVWLGERLFGVRHYGFEKSLAHAVEKLGVFGVGEIALHRVHHNVHAAAGGLIRGQRAGERGVHNGKARAGAFVVDTLFEPAVLVGDDAGVARLAARGGDRQHRADGGACLRRGLAHEEIPDIKFGIGERVADGLRRVDHTAAADGEQKVRAGLLCKSEALAHAAEPGIRLHAAEQLVRDTRGLERIGAAAEQPRAHGAAAAVNDERVRAAAFADKLTAAAFGVAPENDLRGNAVFKVLHDEFFLPVYLCRILRQMGRAAYRAADRADDGDDPLRSACPP